MTPNSRSRAVSFAVAIFVSFLVILLPPAAHAESRDCSNAVLPTPDNPWPEATGADFDALRSALVARMGRATLARTRWSAEIRAFGPCGERSMVFSWEPVRAVRPASTLKLLTTWTVFLTSPEVREVSTPQYKAIRSMMKASNNDEANRILGWAGGPSALRTTFSLRGLPVSPDFNAVDGSGLSNSDRVGARDLVNALVDVRYSSFFVPFRDTLPVGGVDGTLARRSFAPWGTVRAKTGTLRSGPVVGLAGYADVRSGWQLVFAFLGDSVTSVDAGRAAIDGAMTEAMRFYATF